jgi:hypothetical protein
MKKSPSLEFSSTLFEVVEGEDEETNPGIYGKSLAAWLASQLRVPEQDVIAEDFGWCVPVKSSQHRLYVACSSEDDSKDRWRVFALRKAALSHECWAAIPGLLKSQRFLHASNRYWRQTPESLPSLSGEHDTQQAVVFPMTSRSE